MNRRPLTAEEISTLSPYIPQADLNGALLHIGRVPWYLPKRFCAIARGRHVYFREEVCALGMPEWLALLGHELTHVGQYRQGMTGFKYLCRAVFGYRKNRYEQEASAVQARIAEALTRSA